MANYNRYWDLHITHQNGWYDLANNIHVQLDYQVARHGHAASIVLIDPPEPTSAATIRGVALGARSLPSAGYIASTATIADIQAHTIDPDVQALVAWINDGSHIGKLRLNAHGDGGGRLGMASGAGAPWGNMTWVTADHVVQWLIANGLRPAVSAKVSSLAGTKNKQGLITINVAVSMAARHDTTSATLNAMGTNTRPAPKSAVDLIVSALRENGIVGVEVTGSNEMTLMGGGGVPGKLARLLGLEAKQVPQGGGWGEFHRADNGVVSIVVPSGWNVREEGHLRGGVIDIPERLCIEPAADNANREPSQGWIIGTGADAVTVPAGWLLNQTNRTLSIPVAWHLQSNGNERGGCISSDPSATLVGFGENLAKSAAKARIIS